MRILFVHSGNAVGGDSTKYTFVSEQGEALQRLGCEVDYFAIMGHGIIGYLQNIRILRKKIKERKPDVLHAHYGLCGLVANLATRKVPVITTYHGSDNNLQYLRHLSKINMRLSAWNIFVSKRTVRVAGCTDKSKCSVLPCGILLNDEQLQSKEQARTTLGWGIRERKVLFAGAFNNAVKDSELAFAAMNELEGLGIYDAELVELKGYSRHQVNTLMCAADCLLMTSKTEGSPQVIKEAMACGCPIVCVNVGDVAERMEGVAGCYVAKTREPKEIAALVERALQFKGKTEGRQKIINDGLSQEQVAKQLITLYNKVIRDE